jgi:hypothetical protein
MIVYIAGACAGLGLIVGALGLILNFYQLIMFGLGLGLIIGCIFRYIKKSIDGIGIVSVGEKKEI